MPIYQHNHNGTLMQAIADYVREHPGSARADIIEGINYDGPPMVISNTLAKLRKAQVLEKTGTSKSTKWHAIDNKAMPMFLEMAKDILLELKEMHSSVRAIHLAQRLEDLLAETIEEQSHGR